MGIYACGDRGCEVDETRSPRPFRGWVVHTKTTEENEQKTNEMLDHMVELLDKMELDTIKDEETAKESDAAKEEFFALFSKYFHYFWE